MLPIHMSLLMELTTCTYHFGIFLFFFIPARIRYALSYFMIYFLFSTDILGTIDYVTSDGTTVFRTHPSERGKVVFQMVNATWYI